MRTSRLPARSQYQRKPPPSAIRFGNQRRFRPIWHGPSPHEIRFTTRQPAALAGGGAAKTRRHSVTPSSTKTARELAQHDANSCRSVRICRGISGRRSASHNVASHEYHLQLLGCLIHDLVVELPVASVARRRSPSTECPSHPRPIPAVADEGWFGHGQHRPPVAHRCGHGVRVAIQIVLMPPVHRLPRSGHCSPMRPRRQGGEVARSADHRPAPRMWAVRAWALLEAGHPSQIGTVILL